MPGARKSTTKPKRITGRAKRAAKKSVETGQKENPSSDFPIIGLGASAGGLKAFTDFLEAMPDKCGMGFVLIQHLDPNHESLMASLLEKHTAMSVCLAEDNMRVAPDHVYIIPPGFTLILKGDRLKLVKPVEAHGARLPIDAFFRSLAQERQNRAIGIVLSGTGTDGTLGLKAIRQAGGFAIAQDPQEASHDGMPRNAIANAATDEVLAIADMPEALQRCARHPYFNGNSDKHVLGDRARSILGDITLLLKKQKNIDFSAYKEGTLLRRIERRMGIHHLEDGALYLSMVKKDADELERLSKDLLINVSDFFRDPDVFTYLEKKVLPTAIKGHPEDQPFRIWIAGCATGEEAYTYAMLLAEQAELLKHHMKIQIFATDIDEDALDFARAGIYPDSIESHVSTERLKRFFMKEEHRYHVKPELREMIVFARHNLLADAPFSKLDLVSCRNVLIYLDAKIQKRILELFHFSLKQNGILVLGTSETANADDNLFDPLARKYRLYRRKNGRARALALDMPLSQSRRPHSLGASPASFSRRSTTNAGDLTKRILLERYAPAAVLINRNFECLYFSGPIGRYLKIPVGEAGQDLFSMVDDGLRDVVRSVLSVAKDTRDRAESESVWVSQNNKRWRVVVHADPVDTEQDGLLLVTFLPVAEDTERSSEPRSKVEQSVVSQMQKELASARRELRATIDNLEASNEELKAANEEAMSMNEEFQSTNEELETSKEELQSLNEELTTLNNQLQQQVDENRLIVDDLYNLLNSSQIATVFLDRDLKIKRFTPSAKEFFNLIPSDAGRPFSDITHKLRDPDLLNDAQQVLDKLAAIEVEVKSEDGRWFLRRVLPYQTLDRKINGIVVTLFDITSQKESQESAQRAQDYAEAIIDTISVPLVVLDADLRVISASRSYFKKFKVTREETVGIPLPKTANGQWNIPDLLKYLTRLSKTKSSVEPLEIVHTFPSIGERAVQIDARILRGVEDRADLLLLAIEDVTESKAAREALDERNARLESILQSSQLGIISIDSRGTIDSFNSAAELIFGYTSTEVVGEDVSILMPDPDRSSHDGFIAAYLETGKSSMIGRKREVTGLHKDGSPIPLEVSISETKFDHRRLFTGILRDLTVEKKRQEELVQAQKMEAMGQLTGGVAHDFNNLLTIVLGNLELLESGKLPDLHEKLVNEIRGAVDLGSDLTGGLLAFGRRLPLRPELIEVNKSITQMASILSRTLPENINIVSILGDDIWPIEIDPAQFQNAILNLGLNARDAMPMGGKLIFESSNVTLDDEALEAESSAGDYVSVSVTDTGSGMEPDVRMRAFEPFFTTKQVGEGSGLGLSMVYGFVKQSGGHAMIFSDPGQGTTVKLFFPRRHGVTETLEKQNLHDLQVNGNGETILLVEDDPRVRRVTLRRLEMLGYQVLQASNGIEAVALMDPEGGIDLLFTDIVMPGGMSGVDVAREGRKRVPGLKVLLTSGYAEEVLGLDDKEQILRKPYSSVVLARALRDILSQ